MARKIKSAIHSARPNLPEGIAVEITRANVCWSGMRGYVKKVMPDGSHIVRVKTKNGTEFDVCATADCLKGL